MPLLRHRWTPAAGVAVLGVVAVFAWAAWPTVRGPDRATDVYVVASGDLEASTVPVERRIREAGFTVETEAATDWCSVQAWATERLDQVRPQYVVIGLGSVGACGGDPIGVTLTELRHVHVVVVAEPGDAATRVRTAVAARGLTLADPGRLLGDASPSTQPCLWWDTDCSGGIVEVRDAAGALTAAGAERVGRVVAAEIV